MEIRPGFHIIWKQNREGRPSVPTHKILMAMGFLDQGYTFRQTASMTGVSISSLARYRKKYKTGTLYKNDSHNEEEDPLYDMGVIEI